MSMEAAKAVPEFLRNRAPPPPTGTPLQQKTAWLWPAVGSVRHLNSLKKTLPSQRGHIEIHVNPPWQWNVREHVSCFLPNMRVMRVDVRSSQCRRLSEAWKFRT